MPATSHFSLRFAGTWPVWGVLATALGLALIMAFLYRREMRRQGHVGARGWLLTTLRSAAVFIATLTLAAPVLQHVTTEHHLGRVIIAVDGSRSMRLTDETADAAPSPPRWDRAQNLLFSGPNPLLPTLAQNHDVELVVLRGKDSQRLWWRRNQGRDSAGPLPGSLALTPDATLTDLDSALQKALDSNPAGTAVVLLTDGQHNGDGSPEDRAASFAATGTTLYTIGIGSEVPPADLALAQVDIPESAFAEEQLRGRLTVRDSMPAGLPATLRVESQGKLLWEQTFTTTGKGDHPFDFRFPVTDLPPATSGSDSAMRILNVQVAASGAQASQEKTRANNSTEVTLHVLDRRRRVLLLDGRPRWETRYIHNHFDRDERWEVTLGFDDFNPAAGLGAAAIAFPATRDELLTYDLVILGDLAIDRLRPDQVDSLTEFVEKRGGGLIWIDGQRGHLRSWQEQANSLLPVTWTEPHTSAQPPYRWSLDTGTPTPDALLIAGSRQANATLWEQQPTMQWSAATQPAPGAQVCALLKSPGQPDRPAVVLRSVGAGAVLYLSTDELWRWRFQVADLYHQRLWMQLAAWISAPPFQSENETLAIGSDRLRYRTDDPAEIRVRLRSPTGTLVTNATPKAFLSRQGEIVAVIDLTPDATHAGIYRGLTPRLKSGDFDISVAPTPASPPSDLRLNIRATEGDDRELAHLTLNVPLLQSISQITGGQFLREQQAATELPPLLERLDRRQTLTRETLLWSSGWWLGTLLLLLTTEWILRKCSRLL